MLVMPLAKTALGKSVTIVTTRTKAMTIGGTNQIGQTKSFIASPRLSRPGGTSPRGYLPKGLASSPALTAHRDFANARDKPGTRLLARGGLVDDVVDCQPQRPRQGLRLLFCVLLARDVKDRGSANHLAGHHAGRWSLQAPRCCPR